MAYSDEVRTAQQVLAANGGDSASEHARQEALRQAAEDAGVTRSEYIGYEESFANYEARDDIEPLVERRARSRQVQCIAPRNRAAFGCRARCRSRRRTYGSEERL